MGKRRPREVQTFISYSHDSAHHADRVLALSDQLRSDGVDCNIDQYEVGPSEGWYLWMEKQIEQAEFVLIVCTTVYLRRFRGEETGKGATWEGAIITQELFDTVPKNRKFVPVVFSTDHIQCIPPVLRKNAHYDMSRKDGYEKLYRRLTGQHDTPKPKLGKKKKLQPRERRQDFFAIPDERTSKGAVVRLLPQQVLSSQSEVGSANALDGLQPSAADSTDPIFAEVVLTIDGNPDEFTDDDQEKLLDHIKGLMNASDILVIRRRRGSIELTIRLQADQAKALRSAVKRHDFAKFGVVNARCQIQIDDFLAQQAEFDDLSEFACILVAKQVGLSEFQRNHSRIESLVRRAVHDRVAAEVISQFGGRVVKFTADGLFALLDGDDCESRAMGAGIGIVSRIETVNEIRAWRYPHAISSKIGVHAGRVWMFDFSQTGLTDVQGEAIDIALALSLMAGANQIVTTDGTFERAGGPEVFPNTIGPISRFVKGFNMALELRSVVPSDGRSCPEIPLIGIEHTTPQHLRPRLDQGRELLRGSNFRDAVHVFEGVVSEDPTNFEGNFYLGKVLLSLVIGATRQERSRTLQRAIHSLHNARQIRPASPQVSLLLSRALSEYFAFHGKAEDLDRAIEYARMAVVNAMDSMDNDAIWQGLILQARLLLRRADQSGTTEDITADISAAAELCEQVSQFQDGRVTHTYSNCLVVHALIRLAQGDLDYDAINNLLNEAERIDATSPEVDLARATVKRRESGGSMAAPT